MAKEWICNVCATVLKGMFAGWVKNRIEERNEKVMVQHNLNIQMDEDIARVFQASTKTSRKNQIRISLYDYVLSDYACIRIALTLLFDNSDQGRLRQYDEGGHEEAQDQVAD